MRFFNIQLTDNSKVESMIKSPRRIHRATIFITSNEVNLDTAAEIYEYRGEQIQKLRIHIHPRQKVIKISARSFVKLMSKFPNVKELKLEFGNVHIIDWIQHHPVLGSCGKFSLELSLGNDCNLGREFISMFALHSIDELQLYGDFDHFGDLIQSQNAIQRLTASRDIFNSVILHALKLEYVKFRTYAFRITVERQAALNSMFESLARDHPELKQLRPSIPMSPALLAILCRKSNLVSIHLKVSNENMGQFRQLSSLPKTTKVHLDLSDHPVEEITHLTMIRLQNIEKIKIVVQCNQDPAEDDDDEVDRNTISEIFFEQMGRNWSNIKELKLCGQRVLMNMALENLKQLQKLEIEMYDSDFHFHHNSSTYPHMTSLIVHDVKWIPNMSHLSKKLPNLKVLSFDCSPMGYDRPNTFYCNYLLESLADMESLEVLYIGFKVMSAKAIASKDEIFVLKKLCSNLKEFFISFHQHSTHFQFNNHLFGQLQGVFNMEVYFKIRHVGLQETECLALQKNVDESDIRFR